MIVTTNFQKYKWHLQLGNQLFLYCACRIIAKKLDCSYSFPKNWEGSSIIECNCGVDRTDHDLIVLDGWFQNVEYVNRNWFKVKDFALTQTYNFNEICIVHYRGTDHLHNSYVLNNDYYIKAKSKMLSVKPSLKFIVVTDDINSAKSVVKADDYISNTKEEDFKILTLAKYIVLSQSTFSWWGSYLNKEKTYCISPSGWWEPFDYRLKHDHIDCLI